ncbi:hypothetical protein JCM18750_38690 [Halostagnicola bangensis]
MTIPSVDRVPNSTISLPAFLPAFYSNSERDDIPATEISRPETPPPLIGAALSEETAAWLGEWADEMITIATPDHEDDANRVDAFREKAPDKPVYLKVQHSYDADDDAALEGAYEQWRTNCVPRRDTQELRTAQDFDELSETVDEKQVEANVRVSGDLDDHQEWLEANIDLFVEKVFIHNVNTNQEVFLEAFGENVLPALE